MDGILDRKGLLKKINSDSAENIRINLGCGTVITKENFIGIDKQEHENVDIVGDVFDVLSQIPSDSVDHIYSSHFFEHIEDMEQLIKECARVLKRNAYIDIIVPHFSNPYFYSDPTHRKFFGLYTFSYYSYDNILKRQVPKYEHTIDFTLLSVKLNFQSIRPFYFRHIFKKLGGILFSTTVYMSEFWEENLSRIFPCYDVTFRMMKH